jgi:hypothetical protein
MDNLNEIRLVYFNIRGLAEPARWMMKIAGIEFIDERISLDAWEVTRRKGENLIKRRKSSEASGAGKFVFYNILIVDYKLQF